MRYMWFTGLRKSIQDISFNVVPWLQISNAAEKKEQGFVMNVELTCSF